MSVKAHYCTLRISFGVCHDILTSWWVTIDCWGGRGRPDVTTDNGAKLLQIGKILFSTEMKKMPTQMQLGQ